MKKCHLFLLLCLLNSIVNGNTSQIGPVLPAQESEILRRHQIPQEHFSFTLIPLHKKDKRSDRLLDFQGQIPRPPASVIKTFTTFIALHDLGPNFQMKTELLYRGSIENGLLTGDLLLLGGADPFLTFADLAHFIQALRNRGIQRVEGQFYFYENLFLTRSQIADFGHGDQTYNPGISALNLEFNQIKVFPRHNWQTYPPIPLVQMSEAKKNFPQGKRFKRVAKNSWQSSGQNYSAVETIPVQTPGLFTTQSLTYLAHLWGISLPEAKGLTEFKREKDWRVLYSHPSRKLIDLASMAMEFSNNLLTESILIHWFEHSQKRKASSLNEAASQLLNRLAQLTPDVDYSHWALENGSGLSTSSRFTTQGAAEFLARAHSISLSGPSLTGLFSLGGHNGSLARRFQSPDLAMRLWGKTGQLDYVSNLMGILHAQSGESYFYALSLHHADNREVVNNTSHPRFNPIKSQAAAWTRNASQAIEELLALWIRQL